MPAYLDHAASTPLRPAALEAMLPFLREHHGNPSGVHAAARTARKAVDEARDAVAELCGAEPREVVFTSGGTEADNLVVLGVHDRIGGTLVCSAVEHHAVLAPVELRKGRTVAVDARGVLDLDDLDRVLTEVADGGGRVALVSVMLANNEVGAIQPLARIAKRVRKYAPDALVHTDAVQAAPWVDVAVPARSADLVTVSAHKIGGPKGTGAVVVREHATDRLAPRTVGGGQERERRSGTHDVAGIAGFGAAVRELLDTRADQAARVRALRNRMVAKLVAAVDGLVVTAAGRGCELDDGVLPNIAHLCVPGVEAESLLYLLERADVAASAGASCASGAFEPSHVLTAMGVDRRTAVGSLRLSLGWSSTDADVDAVVAALPPAVERLRAFA